ncbi:hypothetical protein HHK36_004004 [Tetracentron sinense]|uniref:Wall-associated receptor kinase galacturonan-binding domain-containing protein n=1 Tax=Tetracentron sinense TaxID=13715 RepID=A0A835DPN6_TETSI|nr:hypothetical protein HHK36_004004 [Tetracentron sinense]
MEVPATFFSFQTLLLLLTVLHFSSSLVTSHLGSSLPGCPNKCGNVNISYPFGIGNGCFFPGFEVTCTQGIPFLAGGLQLFDILPGEVRVSSKPFSIATLCHTRESMDNGFLYRRRLLLRYPSTGAEGVFHWHLCTRGKMESNYSQCSHWFLVEDGTYSFTELDISNLNLTADISTILEWTIGEGNCKDANKKNTSICGENSVCYDSKRHSSYLCECFLWA